MNLSKIILNLACLLSLAIFSTTGMAEGISQADSDAARILMLEKALTPDTPIAVADLFAKANKERNGAVQYMLFSDDLKNKYQDYWQPSWVSGTSSPWITSYTIKKMAEEKNKSQFQITYQWATASGPFQPPLVQTITVEPVAQTTEAPQKLWISQFIEAAK
ncbi:MAG: hypothetical protein H0U73_02460 [Tatlockia sp.]|nr:hypothetical protein [Tatlockia sp.]